MFLEVTMNELSSPVNYIIRRAEASDAEAMQKIFSGPKAIRGTLQLPYPSLDRWRKRLAEPPDGSFNLLACLLYTSTSCGMRDGL